MDLHRHADRRMGCRVKGDNMRNRNTVLAVIGLAVGITLAIFLPGVITAGPDRFGSLPGWDHNADANKSAMVGPSGTDVRWRYGTNVILNVRDFGAIPNDGLDDSSVINTLIASTASTGSTNNNGVQIYIPKGTYDLTSPIRVNRQVVMFGDGGSGDHSSTVLKPTKNITGIQIDGIATSTDGGQGDWSTVRDLGVQYASQTTANWLPSHAYVLNDTVKSLITGSGVTAVAGANWNPDVIFKCTSAGTSAGSEPAWGSKTEGQTVTDGGVTWTAIVVAGVRMRARANVQNFLITNSPGQGVRIDGSSDGTPPTNANGFRVQYGRMVAPAQDAVRIVGIDSNAGQARDLDIAGCGYYGIDDQSFLGNLHEGHQVANCLLGAYRSPGLNARSEFLGCYSESGQPPSSIVSPSLVVGGLHGAGFSTGGTQGTVYGSQLITSATLEHQPVPNTGGTYFTAPYADGYAFRWGSADTFFSMKYAATCLFSGTKCWRMSAENSDATAVFDLSGSDSTLAGNIKGFMGFPRGFFMGPFVQYISHTDIDPSTHEPFSSPSPLRRGSWYWNVAGTTNNGPIEQGGQGALSGGVLGWQKVHDATYSAGPDYFTVRTPHFGSGNTIDVTNSTGSVASPRAVDFLHEAGVTFTNAGATGEVGFKLPEIGGNFTPRRTVEFSFYVADADGLRVASFDSNRKIQWGGRAVADYIESTKIGSWIKLKAEFDMNNILSGWTFAVTEVSGSWTDSNGLVLNPTIGPASAVTGDVVTFADSFGNKLSDSGTPLANLVTVSRAVLAGTGLTVTNSGLLSADITMSASFGATGNTIAQGNDSRFSDSRNPTFKSISNTLTPLGSTQGGAALVVSRYTVLDSAAADGTGIRMPAATGSGDVYFIHNQIGAAGLHDLYPATGDQINNFGTNNKGKLGIGNVAIIVDAASGQWYCSILPYLQISGGNLFLGTNAGLQVQTSITTPVHNFSSVSGSNSLTMVDNLASGMKIQEGTNKYMEFVTSDGAEQVNIYQNMTMQPAVGQNAGHAIMSMSGSNSNQVRWSDTGNGGNHFNLPNNKTDAFNIQDNSNNIMLQFITTTSANGVNVMGSKTGARAPTGYYGEYVSSGVTAASGVTLSNATAANITSISLTAGDWDITGICNETGGAITGTALDCGISTTSATLPAAGSKGDTWVETPQMATASADSTIAVPTVAGSISSTTTYFLVIQASFTIGTPKGYGRISARRMH